MIEVMPYLCKAPYFQLLQIILATGMLKGPYIWVVILLLIINVKFLSPRQILLWQLLWVQSFLRFKFRQWNMYPSLPVTYFNLHHLTTMVTQDIITILYSSLSQQKHRLVHRISRMMVLLYYHVPRHNFRTYQMSIFTKYHLHQLWLIFFLHWVMKIIL